MGINNTPDLNLSVNPFCPNYGKFVPLDKAVFYPGTPPDALPTSDFSAGSPPVSIGRVTISAGTPPSASAPATIVTGTPPTPIPVPTTYPDNHAKISYDNLLAGGTANASSNNQLAPLVLNYTTHDRWEMSGAGSSGNITVVAPSAQTMDHVAIAGVDTTIPIIVTISPDGATFIEVYNSSNPGPDLTSALLITFTPQTVLRVSITFNPATSEQRGTVSNVFGGLLLTMMRPTYMGVTPASLSAKTEFRPKMSDGGQFLGRQIVRKGVNMSAAFKNLHKDWVNETFAPFIIHAQTKPFFYAWNLLEDPWGVIYCWTNADIIPAKQGVLDWLTVDWEMMGHR